jgi:hypothetical protein
MQGDNAGRALKFELSHVGTKGSKNAGSHKNFPGKNLEPDSPTIYCA